MARASDTTTTRPLARAFVPGPPFNAASSARNNTLDRAPDTSTQREQVRAFVPGPPLNAGAQPVAIFPRGGFGPRGRNGFGSQSTFLV